MNFDGNLVDVCFIFDLDLVALLITFVFGHVGIRRLLGARFRRLDEFGVTAGQTGKSSNC